MSNITDKITYTARAIDDIQAALEEHVKNVYMKKLTSWNGLVQYDNVYDASVLTDTLANQNLSKISYATLYTINGTQYYCPGSTLPKLNDGTINGESYNNSRRPIYLFKL